MHPRASRSLPLAILALLALLVAFALPAMAQEASAWGARAMISSSE